MASEARPLETTFAESARISDRTLKEVADKYALEAVKLRVEKAKKPKPCRNKARVFPVTVTRMYVFADLSPEMQEYVLRECIYRGISVMAVYVESPTKVIIPNQEPEKY